MDQRILGDRKFKRELSLIKAQVELLRTLRSVMGMSSSYATDVTTTGAASVTGVPSLQQFEALYSKVTELDHSLDRYLSSNLDQELRLQLLECATYNVFCCGRLMILLDESEKQ